MVITAVASFHDATLLAALNNEVQVVVHGASALALGKGLLRDGRTGAGLVAIVVDECDDTAADAVPAHSTVVFRIEVALAWVHLDGGLALGALSIGVPLLTDGRTGVAEADAAKERKERNDYETGHLLLASLIQRATKGQMASC